MTPVTVVNCGDALSTAAPNGARLVRLNTQGANLNVRLEVSAISAPMAQNVPAVLLDLLEVALYVYAADQATRRGGATDTGEAWFRQFQFHIPVRRSDIWSRSDVTELLRTSLGFLSDDAYTFTFTSLVQQSGQEQLYFKNFLPTLAVDEVLLFSGGIDSLAGALQDTVIDGRRVALVSHSAATKRHPKAVALAKDVSDRAAPRLVHHIPVWATKAEKVGREYSQRTRSFLFAALGTTVAAMAGLSRIRFYENGVTSMNLPIAPQVVGARASRTTHPRVLADFSRLMTALLERPFAVENPFLWKTKTDVVRLVRDSGCGSLIARSVSCSHTFEATTAHPHCGRCSQCIDRRFATLAAGLTDEEDPSETYKVDLLTGARAVGEDRTMAESFYQRATQLREMPELEFFGTYPEISRVLGYVELPMEAAGARVLELHRRHGQDVFDAVTEGIRRYAKELHEESLPDNCLLVLALPSRYCRRVDEPSPDPIFRLEGDFWRVWFENEQALLKNNVGMRYLALLLGSPGQSVHCLDLRARLAGYCGWVPAGSAGDASDEKSLQQYRQRLSDLVEQIAEAEQSGDLEGALDLKREHSEIEQHLKRITDRRGKPRKDADDHQDARQAVTVALRRATKTIGQKHPPLHRHLHQFLKAGTVCRYDPEPRVAWMTT